MFSLQAPSVVKTCNRGACDRSSDGRAACRPVVGMCTICKVANHLGLTVVCGCEGECAPQCNCIWGTALLGFRPIDCQDCKIEPNLGEECDYQIQISADSELVKPFESYVMAAKHLLKVIECSYCINRAELLIRLVEERQKKSRKQKIEEKRAEKRQNPRRSNRSNKRARTRSE